MDTTASKETVELVAWINLKYAQDPLRSFNIDVVRVQIRNQTKLSTFS